MNLASAEWSLASWSITSTKVNLSRMADPAQKDWQPLLEEVLAERVDAQRQLVQELWPLVAGQVGKLCPRRDSVEDLAQEIFIKVFSKLQQYRGGNFEAWVRQIARRVCYDALRKQKIRPEWTFTDVGDSMPEPSRSPDSHVENSDAATILETLFCSLPPNIAWLLNEVELKERSIGEVGREMGWTATAARLRLMRARRKLKQAYQRLE